MNFLRKYVKGFRSARVSEIAPFVGVRETRRIVGEYILNEDDMLACRKFEDRIAMGGRVVDIYDPTPGNSQSCRDMYMRFPDAYYIPFRCLVPKKIDNLLVAGRSISVSYRPFGSTRVMAECMATGQVAGTAAALAVKQNISPRELGIENLRDEPGKDRAIID